MPENDKERKEKIEKLKQEKKQMQEEMDELKGKTKKGKAECVLVFICAICFLLGGILLLIKTDAGGFASSSLAPVIGDVPVLRSILPKELQRKTKQEILAEQAASQAATQDQAGTQNPANTQIDTQQTNTQSQLAASGQSDTQMQDTQQAANGTDPNSTAANGANGQSDTQADTQSTEEAALQDYVKTYTSMRPKAAAQVFDSMMPDQKLLIVKILQNMTPGQRSAILAQMNVQNASDITVEMDKELPKVN